jgi:hypothetical protein
LTGREDSSRQKRQNGTVSTVRTVRTVAGRTVQAVRMAGGRNGE